MHRDQISAPRASAEVRRICMITHSFYESDNRVIRYAEALVQQGHNVDVFALRREPEMATEEVISGVRVFRIQDRFGKSEKSKASFLFPLLRFLIASSWRIARKHHQEPYDLVHVHNIPDFMVFAAWYPKLTGTPVILDIHDIVPELYSSKFGATDNSILVRTLRRVEKISAAFADHVIIANNLWQEKFVSRSAPKDKCSVFINHVDRRVFHPLPPKPANDKLVILFPGGLQWHQGVDIAIRAFDKLRRRLPKVEFHIYGDGIMKPKLTALVNELGLQDRVHFFSPLRIREIAGVMAKADLGVVPKRADSFGNEAYSTKIMEFMSVGVPVVVSNTKIDRYYFNEAIVRFFESGNSDALADAMYEILSNKARRRKMVACAKGYVAKNNWETRKGDYLNLVDSLCTSRRWRRRPENSGSFGAEVKATS